MNFKSFAAEAQSTPSFSMIFSVISAPLRLKTLTAILLKNTEENNDNTNKTKQPDHSRQNL
jgi:hypothetical protein